MTFVFKDDNTMGAYRYGWKPFRHNENEPVMKVRKEETTCLLDKAGKCSVKGFAHDPVKGKTYESPAPELVIKYGKREKSCLVDGEMSSAHANATGTSWGMEISEGSQHHPI